jgi:hypothetical protein
MAINKQPPANRRNEPKNTGLHTVDAVLKHANKTQIIGDESAEGLALLSAEYREQYLPSNAAEHALVDALVNSEWSLRRLRRTEIEIWDQVSDKILSGKGPDGVVTSGETFAAASDQFIKHQRAVDSCERNYFRALKELRRLRTTPSQSGHAQSAAAGRRGSVLQFPQPPRRSEPPSGE